MMNYKRYIFPAILALAFVLRIWQIGLAPFWYDEAFSALLANLPLDRLIMATAGDTHPPLYYLIITIFSGQRSEWLYRLPSALASVAGVYLLWQITGRLGWAEKARLAAALMMAIVPAQLHYAQEARMYAILQMVVLAAYLAIVDNRKILFSVSALALLYLHNYGTFYFSILGLIALARWGWRWQDWRSWPAVVLPGLAYVPWFIVLVTVQMTQVASGYWIQAPTVGSTVYALYMVFGSFGMPDRWQALAMLVFVALLAFGLWRWLEARPAGWLEVAALAFGPLLLALAVSLAWKPVLLFRGIFPSAPFLYLIMLWRIAHHEQRTMQLYAAVLLLPVIVAGVAGHYHWNPINKAEGDLAQQVAYIREQDGQQTLVHTNDSSWIGWAWYAPEQLHLRLRDPDCGRTLGGLSLLTRQGLGVVEVEPDAVPRPAYIAWSLGPTASFCDQEQVYGILKEAEVKMKIAKTDYVEAGLWWLP